MVLTIWEPICLTTSGDTTKGTTTRRRLGGDAPMGADLPCDRAYVCSAGSCRKKPGHADVVTGLQGIGLSVDTVPCLGVCDGPVAAVPIDGRIEIVSRLSKPKIRRKMVVAVSSGHRGKLSRHLVGASTRRKAIRKLTRRLVRAG